MKMVRWDPFKDMMIVKDLLDPASNGLKTDEDKMSTWTPAVDVYETEKAIILTAELPGVEQKDIELTILDDVLTLKGERRFERDVKQENYHRVERNYGHFCRRFTMPCEVEGDTVTASFKEGVLKVDIPKKSPARKISVEIK